ncbi:hypothetical protein GCM10029964_097130 [Kibdelosporangium lantanae]
MDCPIWTDWPWDLAVAVGRVTEHQGLLRRRSEVAVQPDQDRLGHWGDRFDHVHVGRDVGCWVVRHASP